MESSIYDIAFYSRRNADADFLGEAIGVTNNNPGNIRSTSAVTFTGERMGSHGFKAFTSMDYGYRALIKNLQAYIATGSTNIWDMIHRWAPWGDGANNPDNYANKVSSATGIPAGRRIEKNDLDSLHAIAGAISLVEIGRVYSDALDSAYNMLSYESGGAGAAVTVQSTKRNYFGLLGLLALGIAGREYNKRNHPELFR